MSYTERETERETRELASSLVASINMLYAENRAQDEMSVCAGIEYTMTTLGYTLCDDEIFRFDDEKRLCDECGKPMMEGYVIDSGSEHYCSDECLHKHYTAEEYQEKYDEGTDGIDCEDTYWTEWESVYLFD